MFLRSLLFLLALLPLSSQSYAAVSPMISVLLTHDQPGVLVEVKGKYRLYDPNNKEYLSTRFIGKKKYMQAIQDGLRWDEEFPGLHQLKIVPDNKNVTVMVDGIEYQGAITIYDIGGTISVVNEIEIEDFIKSTSTVLSMQEGPLEYLAALAIALRTNAYYQAQNPKTPFWAVNAKNVGYKGYAIAKRNNPMETAINLTKNMVMSHQNAPLFVDWNLEPMQPAGVSAEMAHITTTEAEQLAKKGEHAAQILSKAFPDSAIKLIAKSTP